MPTGMTFVGLTFCGVSVLVLLLIIYAHLEGNRIGAIRFVFDDIRRDMWRHPTYQVWWRAFRIAMAGPRPGRQAAKPSR